MCAALFDITLASRHISKLCVKIHLLILTKFGMLSRLQHIWVMLILCAQLLQHICIQRPGSSHPCDKLGVISMSIIRIGVNEDTKNNYPQGVLRSVE